MAVLEVKNWFAGLVEWKVRIGADCRKAAFEAVAMVEGTAKGRRSMNAIFGVSIEVCFSRRVVEVDENGRNI